MKNLSSKKLTASAAQKKYRHQRALFRALLVASILSGPAFYLNLLYSTDVIRNIEEEGPVDAFFLTQKDNDLFFNSGQTFERVSLVITSIGLSEVTSQDENELRNLASWVEREFTDKVNTHSGPRELARIFASDNVDVYMTFQPILTPLGFDVFLTDQTHHLLPPSIRNQASGVYATVITQESRYGGAVSMQDKLFAEKTKRLLSKYVVDNYLFHFMTEQALMFKKAGRYARGDAPEDINRMERR